MHRKSSIKPRPPLFLSEKKKTSPNYSSTNKGEIVLINQDDKNLCGLIRDGPAGSLQVNTRLHDFKTSFS